MVSDGPSYIVVNNEAGTAVVDAASDLVAYIAARSAPESNADLTSALAELKAEPNSPPQTAFARIASHAAVLLRAPPADFEAILNLLWFVLASAPNFDEVVHTAVLKLTDPLPHAVAQKAALEAVLVSLFNILKSSSPEKAFVFLKIVALSVSTKTLNQYVPQLPQLAEWLREWPVDVSVKREIVFSLAAGLKTQDLVDISKNSIPLRGFLVSVVESDPEFTEAAQILVKETLVDAGASLERTLYKPEILSSSVLSLEGVKKLQGKSEEYYEALAAISVGDYAAFSKLTNPEIVKSAFYTSQARVTALAHLASNTSANELSYAQIGETVQLPGDAASVEPLIVDAVKAGLIQGRMSQLQQKFVVESATVVGPLTDHHWEVIESRLQAWQRSLKSVIETSKKARNNYDLVKALNKLEVN